MYKKISKIYFATAVAVCMFLTQSNSFALNEANDDYVYSGWSAGLGAGMLFFETDEEFNSGLILELKSGYDINERVTVEGSLGYLPYLDANSSTSEDPDTWHLDSSQASRAALDVLYHLNPAQDRTWDPNLGATVGAMYYNNTLEDDQHFDPFGGIGMGIGRQLNRNWVARGDYRFVVAGHDTELNHHVLVSLGYRFGRKASSSSSGEKDSAYRERVGEASDNLKTIYFDFDKSELSSSAQEKLKQNAEVLANEPETEVYVEGHCDERGTEEYNLALGERRASATKEYLQTLGLPSQQMTAVSYGESSPAVNESSEEAWARNRRVECRRK